MTISSLAGINTINFFINRPARHFYPCAAESYGTTVQKFCQETVQDTASIYKNAVKVSIQGNLGVFRGEQRALLLKSAVIFTPDFDFCGGKNVHKGHFS